ncbi:hypothetical protein [Heyndrickxia vini]|uniref:Uncharacterized protein n=1 Tax=Heyndrickxia vini TaxID=1476025 RepID=A0ABX7DYD5_9BACI|nr:hypothetical protein [Heyndrickxia vini]QQZ08508.1 hypothetical protein I5776_15775 [Heyndrickxia vini]
MPELKSFVVKPTERGYKATREEYENPVHHTNFEDDMDNFIPSGKYVLPGDKPPRIRIRDMHKYCKAVGKQPIELTKEEMDQFRY